VSAAAAMTERQTKFGRHDVNDAENQTPARTRMGSTSVRRFQ
jgi:hypothetical protein